MSEWAPQKSTGALILKDGTVFNGFGWVSRRSNW